MSNDQYRPSTEWLLKAAEAEEGRCTSVGGLMVGVSPRCFKCEKSMQFEEMGRGEVNAGNSSPIYGGGFIDVSFHFGSRHDQCLGFKNARHIEEDATRLRRLLACDVIQGYICDDCFEKHLDLFEGWSKSIKTEQTRKV